MARRTFAIVAIIAAVALVGSVGLTVIATDGAPAEKKDGGFLRHLHKMAHHMHGGGHHEDPMTELIEQLELNPEQLARLEKIHEIIGAAHGDGPGTMAELHERLVTQLERGRIETDEIRSTIDGHLEQMREMAYGVADELVALINGLDANQREILLAHLQESH